ncbi:MAG TPA: cob(I)yrinic acid a,c-diamide adenosyltransferase [Gemmatimonadetes bacterium]|nr:ATP:cob(I)alamin adenosyltransferase [Gemmatimonadota bacterium]HAT37198.1 cob(I)yrinic acid a,c-diamide adenosyltransferase [Gemmatimonadota bacterium]HBV05591.1 cob(I)yrinic acid a,c-diamide adenosyltransferase [Gemmatimonadota bacterium]|tara:strand:+ start:5877 stop:6452 length:576 start_codon:yes stop_codon:yes gene_type:complete
MKIYTRTGDTGETGLFGGKRVLKDNVRVDAYGTVDELNATIGWAIAQVNDAEIRDRLELLQHDLFSLGSNLATPPVQEKRKKPKLPAMPTQRVEEMEAWIDAADTELPALRAFVLPGGCPGAAALHVARTVCRRAERTVVRLSGIKGSEVELLTYLNRLSDLLFTLARLENHRNGMGDVEWVKHPESEPSI